jgi:biotin-dependent carboxylase-like uncharacterized protein
MPSISLLHAGFYSSIQDRGRKSHRHIGIPHSGAMDQLSADLGNSLLSNSLDAAVMEIILQGGTYLFSHPTRIAITGAKASIKINDIMLEQNTVLEIIAGDVLKIGATTSGNFIYIAIAGGFLIDTILGSKSFYHKITNTSKLDTCDAVPYQEYIIDTYKEASFYKHKAVLSFRCYPGPEFNLLNRNQQEKLLHTSFSISKDWNRMAFQLEEKLSNSLLQLKSSPVLPGTVQLTANGQLIVLMRDAQTTGGYPRVLQLEKKSISRISQKRVGEKVDLVVI